MGVVRNLLIRGGADFSQLRKELMNVSRNVHEFKTSVGSAVKGVMGALGVMQFADTAADATLLAIRVEAAMQQINRAMGQSSQAFMDWTNTQAAAYNMSTGDAVKYGAIFSNLIGTFSRGAQETETRTVDVLKASSVVASSTGRTMEDVMWRIRSGLLGNTEAIEDLGVSVYVNMLESSKAMQQFANGKSWNQLDFQTQQLIRYYGILEQVNKKFGTDIAQNTNSSLQGLTAVLGDVRLALGQAFLPIVNYVLPYLTAMANHMLSVMQIISAFTRALFGYQDPSTKNTQTQTAAVQGLGDAYKDAGDKAKEAQRGVAGFDEVNTISDSSDKAGSGKSGGLSGDPTVGANPDQAGNASALPPIPAWVQEAADKIKAFAATVKSAFGELSSFMKDNADIIIAALGGIAAGFVVFLIATNWTAIIEGITLAWWGLCYAIEAMWVAISGPIGLAVIAIGLAVAAFIYFYRTNETFRGVVDGILKAIGVAAKWLWNEVLVPFGGWLATVFVAAWEGVSAAAKWFYENVLTPIGNFMVWFWHTVVEPLASTISDVLAGAFSFLSEVAKAFWQDVLVPLGDVFKDNLQPAIEAVSTVAKFLWENVLKPFGDYLINELKDHIQAIVDIFKLLWNDVLVPVGKFIKDEFLKIFKDAFKDIGDCIKDVNTILNGLLKFITDVFKGDWEKAWNDLVQVFGGIIDLMYDSAKGPLNLIIGMINTVIDGLNKISFDFPDWVPGVGGEHFGINIPRIPRLARGGIVDGATDFGNFIAGEAGAEMIVPLENTSFTDKIASALGTAVMSAMQLSGGNSNSGGDVRLEIDGVTFARLINPYASKEGARLGGSMIVAR